MLFVSSVLFFLIFDLLRKPVFNLPVAVRSTLLAFEAKVRVFHVKHSIGVLLLPYCVIEAKMNCSL